MLLALFSAYLLGKTSYEDNEIYFGVHTWWNLLKNRELHNVTFLKIKLWLKALDIFQLNKPSSGVKKKIWFGYHVLITSVLFCVILLS